MTKRQLKKILKGLDDVRISNKEATLSKAEELIKISCHSENTRISKSSRKVSARLISAVCACAVLLACVPAIGVVAADRRDYRSAVEFFQQNDISMAEYSRRDIKLIWKDITSGSFSYDKTADAIAKLVGGYEISEGELSSEELRELWNKKIQADNQEMENMKEGFLVNGYIQPNGISFLYRNQTRYADTVEETYTVIEKYRDGQLQWSKTMQRVSVYDISFCDTYIAMLANTPEGSAVIALEHEGEEIWRTVTDINGVAIIADNEELSVICSNRYDVEALIFDINGRCMHKARNNFYRMGLIVDRGESITSSHTVKNALRIGEEYALQLKADDNTEFLIRIDKNVNKLAEFRFFSNNEIYRLSDVASLGNDLYISGYTLRDENAEERIDKILLENDGKLNELELVSMLKDNYTAVLLKCDYETGEVKSFYSKDGAIGGMFSVSDDGLLTWSVNSIASATYKISHFQETAFVHISGVCAVYEYEFTKDGQLISDKRTDKVISFDM